MRAAGPDARALEVERGLGHGPAVARAADEVGVVTHGLVQEHLVEDGITGHLPQRADGDARLVEGKGEPRDARVLGHIDIGASEQHAVVGLLGLTAPHLLPADDPTVSVAASARRQSREIGTGAGLTEELTPADLTAHDRGHEPRHLFGRPLGQDRRRGHEQTETSGWPERAVLQERRPHDRR